MWRYGMVVDKPSAKESALGCEIPKLTQVFGRKCSMRFVKERYSHVACLNWGTLWGLADIGSEEGEKLPPPPLYSFFVTLK